MSKNIVFVSIFDLTRVFYEVALTLQERGHQVFWLTTNEAWTDWLVARGVRRDNIQQLVYDTSHFLDESEKIKVTEQIVACERQADVTVNQSLLMDRFVLYKNKPDINEYMLLYYRDIKTFLRERQADMVFAEPTNCNELLTYMICKELNIPFLSTAVMRFPADRFLFFRGYEQSEIVRLTPGNDFHLDDGRQLLQEFEHRPGAPSYFARLKTAKVIQPKMAARSTLNRMRLLFFGNRGHLTHHDLPERLYTMVRRVYNGFFLRHLFKYEQLDQIDGRIAFYPLHVQPEASVDVRGSFFSDQLKLIKDIRRSLPFDTTLIVKEHPNFLGQRGRSFFGQLRRIPGVKLVSHRLSTFEIYKRASIIFTITGTSAYEAGMLGIPAVTFTPMFFGGFSSIRHCGSIAELKSIVFDLLDSFERDYEADCRFMVDLMCHSFDGYWTDPLFDPMVMAEQNIRQLSDGFIQVVESESF